MTTQAEPGRKTTRARYPRRLAVKAHSQRDGHACGAHALYALLRFHGWKVRYDDVKSMLGTDHILPPVKGREYVETRMIERGLDYRGTLATDICNILCHLRFITRRLPVDYEAFRESVLREIQSGHPVLAATNCGWGVLHWILVTGLGARGLWVADSLNASGQTQWSHHRVKCELVLAFSVVKGDGYLVPAIARGICADAKLLKVMAHS